MYRIAIVFFLTISFIACKEKKDVTPETPNQTTANVDLSTPEIPGVPIQVLERLLNECTFIDYIFHKLPFSLSQSEGPSIDINISYIDFERPLGRIPTDCKPIGRKFFQISGEIVYDVDIYLTTNCKFYVFVDKKNKPMYANYITDEGVKFYAQMAQQARGTINQ
jgi:hypothetical protein